MGTDPKLKLKKGEKRCQAKNGMGMGKWGNKKVSGKKNKIK